MTFLTPSRALVLALMGAGALVAGCAEPSLPTAGQAPRAAVSAAASSSFHVRGDFSGTQSWSIVSTSPLLYRVDNTAVGTLDPLGSATVVWAVPFARLDLLRRQVQVLNPSWTIVMTLAGGDQILGRYTFPGGTVHLDALGGYTLAAQLEVSGGTGAFAGVGGQGTALMRGNAITGSFTVHIEGEARH